MTASYATAQDASGTDAVTGATRQATTAQQSSNQLSRLYIGGYGEAVMTRNFYSQSFNRYKMPQNYANDKSHGRFDLPHVCVNLGYDFGHGWTMGTEIEFEHGGAGTAVEIEAEEAGEYEAEVEKGGEVNIEQFWLNKAFAGGKVNIKVGEIIVPVGYCNAYHEPNQFFTVYRPEGEATIMPNTWHQVGISVWGRLKHWRYEAQLLSGLNSESFTAEDVADLRARKRVCRLIASSAPAGKTVSACVEPVIFPLTAPESSVAMNFNMTKYTGVNCGPIVLMGQGAGRFPTASAVLRDLSALRIGEREMFPPGCVAVEADNSRERRRYYVRCASEAAASLPLEKLLKNGRTVRAITQPVSPEEMHQLAKKIRKDGGSLFFAAMEED